MRSHPRIPARPLVPWVIRRSITTGRICRSVPLSPDNLGISVPETPDFSTHGGGFPLDFKTGFGYNPYNRVVSKVRSKGPMKNCLFHVVVAWVGVLSASSANVVVCVQPSGLMRMQLTDHQCCSACCDSTCAECSIPTRESRCFLHPDECCQDVVFPFPPAPVITTVISAPAESLVSSILADNNKCNSKIPYIAKDAVLRDSAVETAILLI
jgi:hypothetical protein